MARDALDAGHDDLVEQAEDLSRQVLLISGASRWLRAAGVEATDLSHQLSTCAADARALASEAEDARSLTRVAWLEARAAVARVVEWRRRFRLTLRLQRDPSHDVELLLAALGPKELYLRSSLVLMHRVAALLDTLGDAEAVAEARPLLASLERSQAEVDRAERHETEAIAACDCARERVRQLIGTTRTRWRFAQVLSGDELPDLDLQILRAAIARGKGTRPGRRTTVPDNPSAAQTPSSPAPDSTGCRADR